MEKLAKKLAKNISKKPVNEILKNLLSKQFDGDYDVHLSDLYSDSSLKNLIEDNENFDILSIGDVGKFINISMPVNFEKWESDKFSPLVAVKSAFYNENFNNKIFAYNSNGEKIELNSKKTPNQPIIVIGLNERVVLNQNKKIELKPEIKAQLAKSTDRQIKVNVSEFEEVLDDKGNDTGGGGGYGGGVSGIPNGPGSGKYHVNYCYEYLTAINCTDISQYEGWIAGAPELRLRVHYADFNQGKIADNAAIDILLEPNRRGDINNTWWTVPFDQQLWVWDYTHTGTNQLYSWYEEDESISFNPDKGVDLFSNFKVLTALPGGYFTFAALYLSKTISIKASTEFIGQVEVNARPNIYEYAVGTGLRFRSRTKYCTESDQDIFNYVQ